MRHTALLLLATISLAACKDQVPEIETAVYAPSLGVDLATMTKTPSGLYYKDLVVGTGATVQTGNVVSIHYVGAFPDGAAFDANIAPATPFSFRLGSNAVIQGFEQGLPGAKVGGRRLLVVPPSLGYGSQKVGPIPKNSILVFSVDVLGVS